MIKVVCSIPESRFGQFKVDFPKDWEVVFIDADEQSMLDHIKGADFLFIESMNTVTARVIEAADNLKMIHTQGVGFNYVDTAAAAAKKIYVCNNKGVNSFCVAEHTIGLMLAGLRRTVVLDRECKKARFHETAVKYRKDGSWGLESRHVGIVGFGAIGKEVVKLLKPWGCKVSYFDEYRPSPEVEKEFGVAYLPLEEIFRQCNVISLHVPVLPTTVNMINKDTIQMMSPETLLINCARGEIVNAADLAEALETGRIYGAAIDTIDPEDAGMDYPLFAMSQTGLDRLIVTSHAAGTTDTVFINMLSGGIKNMERIIAGEKPINIQNGL